MMSPHGNFGEHLVRELERADRVRREIERVNREVECAQRVTQELTASAGMARELHEINRLTSEVGDAMRRDILDGQHAVQEMLREQEIARSILTAPIPKPPKLPGPDEMMERLANLRIPVERFDLDLPEIEWPESRTLAEFQQMSDQEIRAFLDDHPSLISVQTGLHVLSTRELHRATKPHWSVGPTFWIAVIATIIGIVVALF